MFNLFNRLRKYRFKPNYPFSGQHDRIIAMLNQHHDQCEIYACNQYEILIKYKDYWFKCWISNYPYAYLQTIEVGKTKVDAEVLTVELAVKQKMSVYDIWRVWVDPVVTLHDGVPSNQSIVQFYETFQLSEQHDQDVAELMLHKRLVDQIIDQCETPSH